MISIQLDIILMRRGVYMLRINVKEVYTKPLLVSHCFQPEVVVFVERAR